MAPIVTASFIVIGIPVLCGLILVAMVVYVIRDVVINTKAQSALFKNLYQDERSGDVLLQVETMDTKLKKFITEHAKDLPKAYTMRIERGIASCDGKRWMRMLLKQAKDAQDKLTVRKRSSSQAVPSTPTWTL
jgi:hypothetical protein